ncbi:multidrug ABC transporter [bacterium]|nr:multidrug ABC transporter [bacterium]
MKKSNQAKAEYTDQIPSTPLRFVWYITKSHWLLATGAILAVILAQVSELGAVYAISQLVDTFNSAVGKQEQLQVLFYWGVIVLVLGILDRTGWRLSGFLGISWLIRVDADAYRKLYSYVMKHSHDYFSNRFAGAISNKISNAAGNSADLVVRFLWDILPEIASMMVTIYLFSTVHWGLGLTLSAVLMVVFFFNLWRVRRRRVLVVSYSEASSRFRGMGVDLMTNIMATRQYVRQLFEYSELNKAVKDKAQKDFRQAFHGEWTMVMNGIFGVILMILILGGTYLMLQNDLASAGQLVLVLILLARVGYAFNVMGQFMNSFIRRYGEIQEGLSEVVVDYEIVDEPDAKKLKVDTAKIEWKGVNFQFDQNQVFAGFDLVIESGQRVGLVGPSGAGKTTFVSLLLRQHDIDTGSIEIDGQDISKVTQDSLRQNIAVVPQEPMLFHRTIRENIAYGKPKSTQKEIEEVAKKAQAHDFIMSLPERYNTLVGERGVKLSGGQKQRVAIARAMLKDAPILVLDEATSALDSESEVAIQKALHTLMEGKTVIAVAHRLSTLREMDRILVLEEGKVLEDGTHTELTNAGGTYQKLWEHQAGGFLQE